MCITYDLKPLLFAFLLVTLIQLKRIIELNPFSVNCCENFQFQLNYSKNKRIKINENSSKILECFLFVGSNDKKVKKSNEFFN